MSSDANIQIVQKAYADFMTGNVPGIVAALEQNAKFVIPGRLPDSGTHEGPSAVLKFFELVAATWTFQAFEPREYVASGDKVVAIGHYAATSNVTGKAMAADWVMVWTIRNGKIANLQEYTDTLALQDAITKGATA